MSTDYYLFFIISFALSLACTAGLIKICHKYGYLDYPSSRKRHSEPTPNMGGMAIFIAVWAVIFIFVLIRKNAFDELRSPPFVVVSVGLEIGAAR